jgi:hypothetical protein
LQILFKYAPGKKAEIREADLPSFCFPEGVKVSYIKFMSEFALKTISLEPELYYS